MAPKRPGIKQSNVTKLLRKGALAPTDHGQEEEVVREARHAWHASFDTLSLSSVPSTQSVQHKASSSILSAASVKQPGPQVSAAEVLQWATQFQHTCLAFCSGSKLSQYVEDIFGPGVIKRFCLLLICLSDGKVVTIPDSIEQVVGVEIGSAGGTVNWHRLLGGRWPQ